MQGVSQKSYEIRRIIEYDVNEVYLDISTLSQLPLKCRSCIITELNFVINMAADVLAPNSARS